MQFLGEMVWPICIFGSKSALSRRQKGIVIMLPLVVNTTRPIPIDKALSRQPPNYHKISRQRRFKRRRPLFLEQSLSGLRAQGQPAAAGGYMRGRRERSPVVSYKASTKSAAHNGETRSSLADQHALTQKRGDASAPRES